MEADWRSPFVATGNEYWRYKSQAIKWIVHCPLRNFLDLLSFIWASLQGSDFSSPPLPSCLGLSKLFQIYMEDEIPSLCPESSSTEQ